ncbi:LysR family transcriptional regulator ArgP [Aeromicrobium sp. CF4.19]|uniref:LysR family transcriptional regulator ArgP n=1 Tax=Aeromicrobium sp. CF4.19 TaxID=3373082 RepID=UPI003EE6143D
MRIDSTLSRTLAAVIDEGTLEAAARRLHLTPSAVSQRLKLLENQLGQRLVVRTKPVQPTEAGRVVAELARRQDLLEHDARAALGLAAGEHRTRLSIAVNADSLAAWFLAPMTRFAEGNDVELEVHREDQDRTATLLEAGTVLAAVTTRADPVAGCRADSLGAMSFEAAAAPAWVERWLPEGPTPTALSQAPRVDYDRADSLQTEWLGRHGVQAGHPPRHLIPSTHDIARAVELGLGWAMVPTEQVGPLVEQGRLVRLGGPPVLTPLFWQWWKEPSALLDALTTEVLAAAREQLEQ